VNDAILEFPQSGERFEGVATFTEWRRQYPDQVRYHIRRVTSRVDLAVVELSISYDGSSWLQGVQLMEFRGDKVARERIYVMQAWEAPRWRELGARPHQPTRPTRSAPFDRVCLPSQPVSRAGRNREQTPRAAGNHSVKERITKPVLSLGVKKVDLGGISRPSRAVRWISATLTGRISTAAAARPLSTSDSASSSPC
jgi:hypothetical protein